MQEHENPSRFCLFCYKTIPVSDQPDENVKNISKLFKLVNRLIKSRKTDILCKVFITRKLVQCCNKCISIVEHICKVYNQLNILQLKLDFELGNLVEKINYANKVPTRWIHVNKVLEEIFLDDVNKKADGQKKIRSFRQSIIEAGNQSKLQVQPQVLLSRTGSIPHLVEPSDLNVDIESPNHDGMENGETGSTSCSGSHERSHTGDRTFKCRFCKVKFQYRSNLTRHLKSVHANEKRIETELKRKRVCKPNDNLKYKLDTKGQETIDFHKKICPICGKKFSRVDGLKIHLEHHKDQSEWKWECHICSKRFTTRENLSVHMRLHTGDTPYKCRFCDKSFRYRVTFTKHLKSNHSNERGLEKELKRKWFTKSIDISNCTKETSNNLVTFENQKDETEYDEMSDLDEYSDHISSHLEIDVDENYFPEMENIVEGPVNISNVDTYTDNLKTTQQTASFQDPQIQIKIEHPLLFQDQVQSAQKTKSIRLPRVNNSSKKLYDCKTCGQKLKSRVAFQKHLKAHTKNSRWKCITCGKRFLTSLGLQSHMRAHKRKNQFKCKYCESMFWYKLRLGKHLKDKHGDEEGVHEEIEKLSGNIQMAKMKKPFSKTSQTQMESLISDKKFSTCRDCKKPFSTLQKLRAHMNSKLCAKKGNGSVGILKCGTCGKTFGSDKELWIHLRNVHEEKVCLDCGKQFKKTFNFKVHLEYHKDPKEWKFECDICNKKCVSSCKLKEHKALHLRKNYKRRNVGFKYAEDQTVSKSVQSHHVEQRNNTTGMEKLVENCNDKTDLDNISKREMPQQSRYGLRANRKTNFETVDDFDSDDYEEMNTIETPNYEKIRSTEVVTKISEEETKISDEFIKKTNRSSKNVQIYMKGQNKSNTSRWRCKTCGKGFVKKFGLNVHVRTHANTKFNCKFCGQVYSYRLRLDNHLKEKHGDEMGKEEVEKSSDNVPKIKRKIISTKANLSTIHNLNRKSAFCRNCKKPFLNLRVLKAHLKRNLCTAAVLNETEKDINCGDCEMAFHLDRDLWLHHRDIHKKKICMECGKQFSQNQKLNLHIEYHKDPEEWKFKCELCGKRCVSSWKLKEHMVCHSKRSYFRNSVTKIGKDNCNLQSESVLAKDKPVCIINQSNGFNKEDEFKIKKSKIEEQVKDVTAFNVLDENNLLTAKGDYFGDGNLVEFEDLD